MLQGQEDPSGKGDSSTHSALFDLELSSRGRGAASELLARLNGSVHDEGSAHGGAGSGDPSVRLPSGLLHRIIYLGRPVMEFELDVSFLVEVLCQGSGRLSGPCRAASWRVPLCCGGCPPPCALPPGS